MRCPSHRNRTKGTLKNMQLAFVGALAEKFRVSIGSLTPSCPTAELCPKGEREPESEEPFREADGSLT